jgi:hypothetical protein
MNDQKDIDDLLSVCYLQKSEIERLKREIESHQREIDARKASLAKYQHNYDEAKEKILNIMTSSHPQSKS